MALKQTLLQIVQDILSDMESDEVNSIDDTVEALEVANIVASTYQTMLANRNWPHQRRILKLEALGDTDTPTHMTLPEEVKELSSVRYDVRDSGETRVKYQKMHWKEPDDFLRLTNLQNNDNTNITLVDDPSGVELLIRNDMEPQYYTSFNDTTIVFNSYDSAIDDTLQTSKTQCICYINLEPLVIADGTVPDLPAEAFPRLIEESRSRCMVRLKQTADPTAAGEAERQRRWLSRKAWRAKGGVRYPNYGRKGRKSFSDPTFKQDRS